MGEFDALFKVYREQADKLITDVNMTPMILHYPSAEPELLSNPLANEPSIIDRLGGRVKAGDLQDRPFSSASGYRDTTDEELITVRRYWANATDSKGYNVTDKKNVCKIISFQSEENKIISADYAIIDDKRITMIGSPEPHGLGGARYITSLWEESD